MSISIGANGASYTYPETDDTSWGDQATLFASAVSAALTSIGLGSTLNAKAVIDLVSTTKGFLPPRMTTTQRDAIASPSTALLIYNTTNSDIEYYDGSNWIPLKISDSPVWNETTVAPSASATEARFAKLNAPVFTGGITVTGDITLPSASDVDLLDNNASALSFDTTGKAGILEIDTTDASEKVKMSGGLDVTSTLTATNGVAITTTSATTPAIRKSDDTNTGLDWSAADQLDIVTGGSPRFRIESTGQIKAVYESTTGTDYNTTLHNGYLCRAWVNFNGIGVVAIQASGNVSSITDNGTGDYTANFTTAMPDVDYSHNINAYVDETAVRALRGATGPTISAGSLKFYTVDSGGTPADMAEINVAVFR